MISHNEKKLVLNVLETNQWHTEEQRQNAIYLQEKLAKLPTYEHPASAPKNVAQLGSLVTIKTSFGYRYGLQIVLPDEGDIAAKKLSILSSIGAAVYGEPEGAVIQWQMGDEFELVEVIKVI